MKPTDSAFPIIVKTGVIDGGMDIRTYLAGQAMQGILSANPEILHGNIEIPIPSNVAGYAVRCADALIEQLNKKEEEK